MGQLIAVQMTMNAPVLRNRDRSRLLTYHNNQRIALLREPDRRTVTCAELRREAAVLRQRQETMTAAPSCSGVFGMNTFMRKSDVMSPSI